jgi:hypothetical protein
MTTRFRPPTITNAYVPIGNEIIGELAFNTDTNEYVKWNGAAWVSLSVGGGGGGGVEFVPFPASPSSPGSQGQMAYDAATGQFAICVATNTWRYQLTAGAPL